MSLAVLVRGMAQLRHHHQLPVLLVSLRILLALVVDAIVVGLRDAHKLAVVARRSHHAAVIQLHHGRQYAEAVADLQLFARSVAVLDLHVAVDQHTPRVQLLAVVHHHRAGLFDDGEHHHRAQRSPHRQRHVGEGAQIFGELEQRFDIVVGAIGRILFEALANGVANGQALFRMQTVRIKEIYVLLF